MLRFEVAVGPDGTVTFTKNVRPLGLPPGAAVTVQVFGGTLSPALRRLGVTDDEVERIGTVQMEERDNVTAFLACQGTLRKSGFARRKRA